MMKNPETRAAYIEYKERARQDKADEVAIYQQLADVLHAHKDGISLDDIYKQMNGEIAKTTLKSILYNAEWMTHRQDNGNKLPAYDSKAKFIKYRNILPRIDSCGWTESVSFSVECDENGIPIPGAVVKRKNGKLQPIYKVVEGQYQVEDKTETILRRALKKGRLTAIYEVTYIYKSRGETSNITKTVIGLSATKRYFNDIIKCYGSKRYEDSTIQEAWEDRDFEDSTIKVSVREIQLSTWN